MTARIPLPPAVDLACDCGRKAQSLTLENTLGCITVTAHDCGAATDEGCAAPVCDSCDGRCDDRRYAGGQPYPSDHRVCCLCAFRQELSVTGRKWDRDDLCAACCERYDAEPAERREAC